MLSITGDALLKYAARRKTRQEHLVALREIYGYRMVTGKRVRRMKSWLAERAEAAGSGEDLVRGFVEECRRRLVILPAMSTIEQLCADALVAAERRIDARIANVDIQRCVGLGPNKGEPHHALKNALRTGRPRPCVSQDVVYKCLF